VGVPVRSSGACSAVGRPRGGVRDQEGKASSMTDHVVLDLFAGHGFGVALRKLGVPEHAVEVWQKAIDTRLLNDLSDVVYRDAWDVDAAAGLVWGTLTGGPPCQLFSAAGKGTGRKLLPYLLAAIKGGRYQSVEALRTLLKRLDPENEDD